MAYADFKSYIQAKYSVELKRLITAYVNEKHDAHGFHSYNVLSLCDQVVDNVEIKSMKCQDDMGPLFHAELTCTADIVMLSLGTSKTEADRSTKWFTVEASGYLANGLKDFTFYSAREYNPSHFKLGETTDEFLIPYISTDMLEDEAEDFYRFYCAGAIFQEGWRFPVDYVFGEMGIDFYEAPLPDNEFGRMYFNPAFADIYEYDSYIVQRMKGKKERRLVNKEIMAGTMLINDEINFMNDIGSHLNTIAHEIIHWDKHQKFFEILSLLNDDSECMSCAVQPEMAPENLEGVQKAIWWAEWQANALAPRILMPREVFLALYEEIYERNYNRPHFSLGNVVEDTLTDLGKCFGVSKYAAKTRAIQLGFTEADGAFIFVDGVYHSPINYKRGVLGKNQTFIVDRASAENIINKNESIRRLVDSGAIVYTGSVFCLNDPKYIRETDDVRVAYELTQYAQDHVDECCLIFDRTYNRDATVHEAEVYSLFYLSKEVSASPYIEAKYSKRNVPNQSIEEIAEQIAKVREAWSAEKAVLNDLPEDFAGTVEYHMKRKGITYSALSARTGLSDTTIKNYRYGKKEPPLDNLMALFIGLNLPEVYCDDMLTKLGYALNNTDKHRIYRMLIHEYNDGTIMQWNKILEAAGYDLIPKKTN